MVIRNRFFGCKKLYMMFILQIHADISRIVHSSIIGHLELSIKDICNRKQTRIPSVRRSSREYCLRNIYRSLRTNND